MKVLASQQGLKTVFAQAQRIAASFCEAVGPRELLLAAVSVCPGVVVDCARTRGIELRRLIWALREWGPINTVDPAMAVATTVTSAARDLMTHAANSGSEQCCSALVQRLLDPATFDSPAAAEAVESRALGDLTGVVLSRLKLI